MLSYLQVTATHQWLETGKMKGKNSNLAQFSEGLGFTQDIRKEKIGLLFFCWSPKNILPGRCTFWNTQYCMYNWKITSNFQQDAIV